MWRIYPVSSTSLLSLPCTDSVGPLFAVSEHNERLIREIGVNILHSAESWRDNEDETDRDRT